MAVAAGSPAKLVVSSPFSRGRVGRARVMYGRWCSALSAQQPLAEAVGRAWQAAATQKPEFHTHHSGTKGPPAEPRQPPTHSKTIPVAAGRAGELGEARRGEPNGARRDRRGFGCRKRWNCSCSFLRGWTVSVMVGGRRRHTAFASVEDLQSSCLSRGYIFGEDSEEGSGTGVLLAGGVWGMSPCLFDCGDRGGANYQRVP